MQLFVGHPPVNHAARVVVERADQADESARGEVPQRDAIIRMLFGDGSAHANEAHGRRKRTSTVWRRSGHLSGG